MRLLALFLICPAVPAFACEPILSCTAKGGAREIELCLDGDAFTYAYGPLGGPPELRLTEPLTNGTLYPWQGVGRAISESITFINGPYRYEVSYSVDRLDENHPTDGGVHVTRNGADVALIPCDPGAKTGFFAAQDAMTALGLCWSRDAQGWTPICP